MARHSRASCKAIKAGHPYYHLLVPPDAAYVRESYIQLWTVDEAKSAQERQNSPNSPVV
jgi:hypothetical protein